ncbi:2-dehydro-3-deoxygalactonokinase [Sphingobium sp. AN558]|uniref:2-dehydro-3-deoxygalactonokinase n=1 Tax=Sphingobium sp. AN558 TaxID=3133442 RepID=UPI0030C1F4E8
MPMLLAGMIGSNRGWMEAPYVPCPAIARPHRAVAMGGGRPHRDRSRCIFHSLPAHRHRAWHSPGGGGCRW